MKSQLLAAGFFYGEHERRIRQLSMLLQVRRHHGQLRREPQNRTSPPLCTRRLTACGNGLSIQQAQLVPKLFTGHGRWRIQMHLLVKPHA